MASSPPNQSATVRTFSDALKLQARVIFALILRETRTTFGDTKIGYLWALFEPVAYLGVFIFIFTAIGRASPLDVDIPYFFLTGLLPFLLFRKIVSRVMSAENSNKALISYPQVTTFDTKIARAILETCIYFIILCFLLNILPLFGFIHTSLYSPTAMIICLLVLAIFAFAFGCISSYIQSYWPPYEKIYNLTINRSFFFLSGIFYLPEQIPKPFGDWLYYNPLARFIAWFRESTFTGFESTFSYTTNFIFVVLLVLFLGLYVETKGK